MRCWTLRCWTLRRGSLRCWTLRCGLRGQRQMKADDRAEHQREQDEDDRGVAELGAKARNERRMGANAGSRVEALHGSPSFDQPSEAGRGEPDQRIRRRPRWPMTATAIDCDCRLALGLRDPVGPNVGLSTRCGLLGNAPSGHPRQVHRCNSAMPSTSDPEPAVSGGVTNVVETAKALRKARKL